MKVLCRGVALLAFALFIAPPALAEPSLPWEKDYPSALAKAKAEKRPLFLMLTATWCGPCKMLERQTLPDPAILSGLQEFVWVKAYEDEALNKKFQLNGYPTLVFLDASNERVLARSSGFEPPGSFLRRVLAARRAASLPLSKDMQDKQAKSFTPDEAKVQSLIQSGDANALVDYLAPLKEDALREQNFLVARLRLPPGVEPEDVQATAWGELPVPASGLLLIPLPRHGKAASLRILAPACAGIDEEVRVDEQTAVAMREFTLKPLAPGEAASFSGQVLRADGQPGSNAIVRICDWATTRTDAQGRFRLDRICPGAFLVRAEAPGGEFQQELTFAAGQELKQDLPLQPVTTVGIRWALQLKEGSPALTGKGVRTGEAYFSVAHGRFLLSRGAEVPQYYGSDFMLRADWQDVRQYIEKDKVAELEKSNGGAPIFWLFDSAGARGNGLHAETARFENIDAVNNGRPFNPKSYFKFLRGDTVRKGQVYTVRCVRKDCYAKMEITDVTVVPQFPALPEEKPLWAGADFKNIIRYEVKETVKTNGISKTSLSGSNRVFSFVADPTYSIHRAEKASANGVGLVICPGGGYRDVWLDREGHDLALWLKPKGITSLVLKYRTNHDGNNEGRQYAWDTYLPAVFADAHQAIRILRAQAAELNLDPNKIGICGFSAGGNLAFNAVFRPEPADTPSRLSGIPNFAGLFYPWLREDFDQMVANTKPLPPLFIMNAIDDPLTPVNRCVDFSQTVLKANGKVELHLFAKGGHGFDMGDSCGESAPLWKQSFVAWLKDCGFIR